MKLNLKNTVIIVGIFIIITSCSVYTTYLPVFTTKNGNYGYYNRKIDLYNDGTISIYYECSAASWDIDNKDANNNEIVENALRTRDKYENLQIKFYIDGKVNDLIIKEYFNKIEIKNKGLISPLTKGEIESGLYPKIRLSLNDTIKDFYQKHDVSVWPIIIIKSVESSRLVNVDTIINQFKINLDVCNKHIYIERQDTLLKKVFTNKYYHNIHK